MYQVYILRCSDGTFYTGITTQLERRVSEHNKGIASKYTRSRIPVELVYWEKAQDRSKATKRELEIKKWSREKKNSLIKKGTDS